MNTPTFLNPLFRNATILKLGFWIPILFCALSFYGQSIKYVRPIALGTAEGTSWANATADIQAMINSANPGDEIWVAAGTYIPNRKGIDVTAITPNDRYNTFRLKEGVKIYGGFAGTETALSERNLNFDTAASILSGDFNGDDTFAANGQPGTGNAENAYNVVLAIGHADAPISAATVLDGFMITGGNMNLNLNLVIDGENMSSSGAGMLNRYASPTVSNVIITGNSSIGSGGGLVNSYSFAIFTNVSVSGNNGNWGGGMTNAYGGPTFLNSVISDNTATGTPDSIGGGGGGAYNYHTNATFLNTLINRNTANSTGNIQAGYGGGVYNAEGSIILTNVSFSDNTAIGIGNLNGNGRGGAIFNSSSPGVFTNLVLTGNAATGFANSCGGGMYVLDSNITLTNATIAGNTLTGNATSGGGIYCQGSNSSAMDIRNTIIYGNTASGHAGVFSITAGLPHFSNSLVEGSSASWVNIGVNEAANMDSNPLFVNAANDDHMLQAGSPSRNTGSNTFFAADATPDLSGIVTDRNGNPRIADGIVDMGAYEFTEMLGLPAISPKAVFSCYPNPVASLLTIDAAAEIHQIDIYNMLGQCVRSHEMNSNNLVVDLSPLANGTYVIKAFGALGTSEKLVIKKSE